MYYLCYIFFIWEAYLLSFKTSKKQNFYSWIVSFFTIFQLEGQKIFPEISDFGTLFWPLERNCTFEHDIYCVIHHHMILRKICSWFTINKRLVLLINPLGANPTKWSNTLKKFVGFCGRIVWACLTILWGLRLKG